MPGQKITEADHKKVHPKLICCSCDLLLSAPMQTPCGHLLCYDCMQTLLSSPNPACPSDGTWLKQEEVFHDRFTHRELMALILHCPNEPCPWSGMCKDLEEHSVICDHTLLDCVHDQCKMEVKRSLLVHHLETACLHRQVICKHCNETLAFNLLEKHVSDECLEAPLACKYCGMSGLRRTEVKNHETVECEKIPTVCEFKAIGCDCAEVMKREELRQHLTDASSTHVMLILKIILDIAAKVQNLDRKMDIVTTLQAAQEEVRQLFVARSTDVEALAGKSTAMLRTLTVLQKRVESRGGSGNDSGLAVEVRSLKATVLDISSKCDSAYRHVVDRNQRLENEMQAMELEIVELRERLDRADLSSVTSCNGTLLWRIVDSQQNRRDAVSGIQTVIYSPHFYTHQFGYKMCARVYLNGDAVRNATRISLFFLVMKGEYDALLPWPFRKTIIMTLLHQNNGADMTGSFRAEVERPTAANMNIASGGSFSMQLDALSNAAYVKDNTMFIRIMVHK